MMRVTKIVAMLAVYLAWICGNSITAISCHANRVDRHLHYHADGVKSCCCCHEGWETPHFEQPHGCNHDHSNKIALYDTTKRDNINIEPIMLSIAAQISDDLRIEEVHIVRNPRCYERKVPLPSSPDVSRRGLRAPPVVA